MSLKKIAIITFLLSIGSFANSSGLLPPGYDTSSNLRPASSRGGDLIPIQPMSLVDQFSPTNPIPLDIFNNGNDLPLFQSFGSPFSPFGQTTSGNNEILQLRQEVSALKSKIKKLEPLLNEVETLKLLLLRMVANSVSANPVVTNFVNDISSVCPEESYGQDSDLMSMISRQFRAFDQKSGLSHKSISMRSLKTVVTSLTLNRSGIPSARGRVPARSLSIFTPGRLTPDDQLSAVREEEEPKMADSADNYQPIVPLPPVREQKDSKVADSANNHQPIVPSLVQGQNSALPSNEPEKNQKETVLQQSPDASPVEMAVLIDEMMKVQDKYDELKEENARQDAEIKELRDQVENLSRALSLQPGQSFLPFGAFLALLDKVDSNSTEPSLLSTVPPYLLDRPMVVSEQMLDNMLATINYSQQVGFEKRKFVKAMFGIDIDIFTNPELFSRCDIPEFVENTITVQNPTAVNPQNCIMKLYKEPSLRLRPVFYKLSCVKPLQIMNFKPINPFKPVVVSSSLNVAKIATTILNKYEYLRTQKGSFNSSELLAITRYDPRNIFERLGII